jgi:hypothetical protein
MTNGQRVATPLFDTERTEAEMKLSAQSGLGDEGQPGNFSLLVQDSLAVQDVPLPTDNGGFSHTTSSRAKISAANKGKTPWNKGKTRSPEVRARIAAGVNAKNRERFLVKLADLGVTEEEFEQQKKDERNKKAAESRARKTEKGGYRPTDETKQKISAILKAKWANGEMPKRRVDPTKVRKGFKHTDETRAKISEALREKWASDDNYRDSMTNKTTAHNGRLDMRQKISETLKAKWQDPEFREKMMEKIRTRKTTSVARDTEYRRKISDAMKAKWQDPEYRDKTTASIRERAQEAARVRPPKPPKQPKAKKQKEVSKNRVRLAQVAAPRIPRRKAPLELDENGEPVIQAKVKKVVKKKKKVVKMAAPLTADGDIGDAPVKKVKKAAAKKKTPKEPDGSINRLRDERRDLYDLLYGDDEDDDDIEEPAEGGMAAMLDLEDDNLDTFDPYGLEDF